MYRILIVDDELDVLEYFQRIFREQLGNCLDLDIYAVDSAKKALEYFGEFKVDIIVSDIQMPEMSGVEMYQIIRQTWPKVRIVFLTGFLEIDYVYAVAQDVNARFLTKLEPVDKIIATLSEVITEIEQSYKEQELLKKAEQQSQLILPILQNNAMYQLLMGNYDKIEDVADSFDNAQIKIDVLKEVFLIGASLDAKDKKFTIEESRQLGFIQESIMREYFSREYEVFFYLLDYGTMPYIWILQRKDIQKIKLTEELEYVQNIFRETTNYTISFTYSSEAIDCRNLPRLYKRAKTILGYRDFEVVESIIPCMVFDNKQGIVGPNIDLKDNWKQLERMSELEGYMELGKRQNFFQLFAALTDGLEVIESMNYTVALEIYFKIAVMLMTYINLWQLNEKIAGEISLFKLLRIDMHTDWQEAVMFLKNTAQSIFDIYFEEEKDGIANYIMMTKSYIKENTDKELTLIMLAEHVHLNASYLSRLFKKATGIKLYDYILKVRMNKAKELILKSNMKIQEIALAVGYESVQSFNRAFKKQTGSVPLDFRTSVNNSSEK